MGRENIFSFKSAWFRVANNPQVVKYSMSESWMGYPKDSKAKRGLVSWKVRGVANEHNVIPRSSNEKDQNSSLSWIDFFGDITINDGVATITLLDPPAN